MPKNNSIDDRDPAARAANAPNAAAVTGGNGVVSALPPGAPNTPAVGALWPALSRQAGGTTAELAEGRQDKPVAAAKALAALEEAGLLSRTRGGRHGARLLPDHWHPKPLMKRAVPGHDIPAEAAGVHPPH